MRNKFLVKSWIAGLADSLIVASGTSSNGASKVYPDLPRMLPFLLPGLLDVPVELLLLRVLA